MLHEISLPVPVVFLPAGHCSTEQKNLACTLLHSANVDAAHAHPSGQHDAAYSYNNLQDMCAGRQAHRSHYTCSECRSPGSPGGFTCLSTNLLKYLVDLKNHGTIIINELAGACHSCNSRHYSGLAVDLHGYDRAGRDRRAEYISKCESYGGWAQDEGNHIHCQMYDAGTCSAQQKTLACQLAQSANIDAARAHPSGQHDSAYAYNNLHDMCAGHQAHRSQRAEYLSKCVSYGGWAQDEGNHIHCQMYDGPHPNWK
nr:hypothetical protein BaRGS_021125 [Batillaria attramentaria]